MKFTSLTEHFRAKAALAERAVGKSTHLPILSHFLLHAEKNRIHITATDLDIALIVAFSGKIEETGAVSVPARILLEFLSYLGEEKVDAYAENRRLTLRAGSYHATLQGLDPEEFPIIPKLHEPKRLEMPADQLRVAVGQVVNAASVGDTRPELSGVLFSVESDGTVTFAATDSFRLAEKKFQLAGHGAEEKFSALIPLRTAQEILRISQETGGNVAIESDANQIRFLWEDVEFFSRLMENNFPDYGNIVPKGYSTRARVPKKKFLEALRVAGAFSTKMNDVRIAFKPPEHLIIRSANAAVGENEATLASIVEGKEAEIAFNYRFLIAGIENLLDGEVFFEVASDSAPAVLRSPDDVSYFYLLMPIRL